MSDEDLELDDVVVDSPEIDESEISASAADVDCRRKLEQKLEEVRLKKLMDDYDYDLD